MSQKPIGEVQQKQKISHNKQLEKRKTKMKNKKQGKDQNS